MAGLKVSKIIMDEYIPQENGWDGGYLYSDIKIGTEVCDFSPQMMMPWFITPKTIDMRDHSSMMPSLDEPLSVVTKRFLKGDTL